MPLSFLDRLILPIAAAHAHRTYRTFLSAAQRARRVQERLLASWLRRHAGSAFGQDQRLSAVQTYDDFASRVRISSYENLAPYVERVRRGETTALLHPRQRVLMFAMTSGTTAQPKFIPVTREFLRGYQRGWNAWGVKALLDHPGSFLRSIVQVSSPMRDQVSESGRPCGAITGLLAASQKRLVRKYYVSPLCVADIRDATARYYCIMRLAVVRDVAFMVAANPQTLLLLARTADQHRQQLIRDVRDGGLWRELPIDETIRAALAPRLRPAPDAARRLERLVEQHGALRPRDCWRLSFVAHWTGGTMGLYRPLFPEWYGDVPVRDPGLLASEGRMSIPVDDNTASGILDVTTQFYEFIPADAYPVGGEDRSAELHKAPVRRAHELREGQEYFILLTNSAGLCRYDIGDRVRVTGRVGEAPLIEFLSKGAHTASLAGEKLTEAQVVAALAALPAAWKEGLMSCVLAPQFDEPPYYRLYADAAEAAALPVEVAAELDARLSAMNIEYASKRKSGRLGGVRFRRTRGRFLRERDARLRASSSSRAEQFKHQYLLAAPGADAGWELEEGE